MYKMIDNKSIYSSISEYDIIDLCAIEKDEVQVNQTNIKTSELD